MDQKGEGLPSVLMEMLMNGAPDFAMEEKTPRLKQEVVISFEQSCQGCKVPIEIYRTVAENTQEMETLYVDIPEGVDNNEFLLVKGKGNFGRNGEQGDLELVVKFELPPNYTRKGLDLHYKQKITLKEALCGFAFELDVRGKKMKIVSGQGKLIVHPNTTKTVPGVGVVRDGVRGNLVISFDIQFPETLSLETITALEAALPS